jgi:hypothetical protein
MSSRTKSGKSDDMDDAEKNRRAAWVAIRCASAVAQAQRSRMLLIGDTAVTSQPLSEKARTFESTLKQKKKGNNSYKNV